jgi:glycosyltransferase involved in cell wall biosynthesis
MKQQSKYRFLFVGALILGKNTAFQNLRDAISSMDNIDSTWVTITMDPPEFIAHVPPISWNHSLMFGLVARQKVLSLEKSGKVFNAAFFNHILPAVFLRGFRARVPSVDSLDVTPCSLLENGQAYYSKPRKRAPAPIDFLKKARTRALLEQAKYLLPYSSFTRNSLIRDYGISDEKIVVLPPGTNLRRWHRAKIQDREPTRQHVRILFVGGDFKRKGGDLLLAVAQRQEFSHCEFHFVTKNFLGNQPKNVIVHRELTHKSEELVQLYSQADIFALPTRADFSPTNALSEAMAAGLPTVSTSVGGLDEIVRHGRTGFLVPVDDVDALAESLRTLQLNPELRHRMGTSAREFAEAELDVEKNASRMVELMKRVAKSC